MDEPLSNLDATLKAEIRDELLELHETFKPTIIYVTHDQAEALTLATRLAIMREGQIEQVGSIEELFYHPQNEYIGTFLGIPKMLLYKYKVSTNSAVHSFMGYNFTLENMRSDTIDIGPIVGEFVRGEISIDEAIAKMQKMGEEVE